MSQMKHDFELEVLDALRVEEFTSIFGGPIVPVKSPIPSWELLGESKDERLVYMLDFRALEADQKARLVEHLVKKYEAPAVVILAQLNERGLPIIAGNTVVQVKNPQRWF